MDRPAAQPEVPQDRDARPAPGAAGGPARPRLAGATAAVLRAEPVEEPLETARDVLASASGHDAVEAATVLLLAGEHEEARGPLDAVVADARAHDDAALRVGRCSSGPRSCGTRTSSPPPSRTPSPHARSRMSPASTDPDASRPRWSSRDA